MPHTPSQTPTKKMRELSISIEDIAVKLLSEICHHFAQWGDGSIKRVGTPVNSRSVLWGLCTPVMVLGAIADAPGTCAIQALKSKWTVGENSFDIVRKCWNISNNDHHVQSKIIILFILHLVRTMYGQVCGASNDFITISQLWFCWWPGTEQVPSLYANQCWRGFPFSMHIFIAA